MKIGSVNFIPSTISRMFANGFSSGICIEISDSYTNINPIFGVKNINIDKNNTKGVSLDHASVCLPYGGRMVSQQIASYLQTQQIFLNKFTHDKEEIIDQIKVMFIFKINI